IRPSSARRPCGHQPPHDRPTSSATSRAARSTPVCPPETILVNMSARLPSPPGRLHDEDSTHCQYRGGAGTVSNVQRFKLPFKARGNEPLATILCPSARTLHQSQEVAPMAVLQQLSTLALKHVVDGACKAFGFVAGASLGEAVAGFLGQRFADHSQRLTDALSKANDNAWKALEIALAGESWWDKVKVTLSRGDEQGFRKQVQAFLDATPLAGLLSHGSEFRALAVRELREARKK